MGQDLYDAATTEKVHTDTKLVTEIIVKPLYQIQKDSRDDLNSQNTFLRSRNAVDPL